MCSVKVQCCYWLVFCYCFVDLAGELNATKIECIPLKDCQMAMTLIKTKKYAPETIEFLKSSHCGIDNHEPMVFCPEFPRCQTFNLRNGTCAHVHNCTPLLKAIKELDLDDYDAEQFLEDHRCYSSYDDDYRVCCPQEDLEDDSFPEDNFIFDQVIPSPHLEPPEDRHAYVDSFQSKRSILPDPNKEECGIHILEDNRITGGSSTELGEYPWMALLMYETKNGLKNGCGGSLINSRYVITAGHCLNKEIIRRFNLIELRYVVLGEYDTNNKTDCIYGECSDPPLSIPVRNTKIHPKFSVQYAQHDIGLIELEREISFTEYIRPICLANQNFVLKGNETFVVAGWGQTFTMLSSPVKLKARVKVASLEKCKKLNQKIGTTKGQICAGKGDGKDTCKGDSGGPLMLGRIYGSQYVNILVGITSYGFGNCGTGPSVYTYVPTYFDWIKENIG